MLPQIVFVIWSLVKKQNVHSSRILFYFVLLVAFYLVAISLPDVFLIGFEHQLFVLDFVLITFNLLGVATAFIYTKKIELFSNLPDSLPELPSYDPLVIVELIEDGLFNWPYPVPKRKMTWS